MIRLLILLGLFAALAAGASWVVEQPGRIAYEWRGVAGTLTVSEALVLAGAALAAAIVLVDLARSLFATPGRLARRSRERRRGRAAEAHAQGLVAVAAGDFDAAARAARLAERVAPEHALSQLLGAQVAQMRGDRPAAEARFRAMAERDDTVLLGLRGLSVEAERAGEAAAARAHARAANRLDPTLPWAAAAAFHAATAERDFDAALALNEDALRHKLIDRETHRRRRAVLLTALARASDGGEAARRCAVEAHQLARDLVPAAVAAARLLAPQSARRASGVLDATYKLSPHPELFAAALELAEGQSAVDRLRRAEALAALRPEHVESGLGVAAAARAARELARARAALRPFLQDRPSQRVCAAMAEVEALAGGPDGEVRAWLARAVRAPRDPAWIADGVASDAWDAVSPVTGELDRYVWRVPDGGSAQGPELELAPPAALAAPDRIGDVRSADDDGEGWPPGEAPTRSDPGGPRGSVPSSG
ncbi:heme biosynthesis HemY N-terminal domain-containing protein [Acuticoccus sp.]|uniref:heme biosynthesis HemY N-terminal domain-containing protein n=1 Tax=Acuticoccus sp. TaxID=1904378 RepID=UPI003B51F701